MSDLEILTPAARPIRPAPRWALVMLGASIVLDALHLLWDWLIVLAVTTAVIALAAWLEERLFVWLSKKRAAAQMALTLALIPAGLILGIVATILLDNVLGTDNASVAGLFGGLWLSSSAFGSAIVVAIDGLGRLASSRFVTRLRLVALGIVGTWVFITIVATVVLPEAISRAFDAEPDSFTVEIEEKKMTGTEFREYLAEQDLPEFLQSFDAAQLVGWFVALLILVGLVPAVWGAASKLAELAMERIHPLDLAMARVKAGDLNVRVEEGGQIELKRLATQFNSMVEALDLAKHLEQAFGAYVSQPILDRIRAQHGSLALPTEEREATVFFADIRGYTALSEALPPDKVLDLLRAHYADILEIIEDEEGYVDKFIGDAVYVVFNGPIEQPDHVERGTRCAIRVQDRVKQRHDESRAPEIERLSVGIGVATGRVICGNLGTAHSTQFSVIGDTVNLAARLSSHAPAGEVWVSEATASGLTDGTRHEALEPIHVKGKANPVQCYRVWADQARSAS